MKTYCETHNLLYGICTAEDFSELRPLLSARNQELVGFAEQDIEKRISPALSLPGGVYNFGSSNTENMVHTAQQFAQELDIAVQIEAADWTRNLVMDGKKLEKAGIRFDTTQQGIRHCLRDYGLASR